MAQAVGGGEHELLLTQSDLNLLQRSASAGSFHTDTDVAANLNARAAAAARQQPSGDVSVVLFPSYIVKSFRLMLSQVAGLLSNVLHVHDMNMWLMLLSLSEKEGDAITTEVQPPSVNPGAALPDAWRFLREDLLLRLVCRKAEWFTLRRCEDDYASLMAKLPVVMAAGCDGGVEDGEIPNVSRFFVDSMQFVTHPSLTGSVRFDALPSDDLGRLISENSDMGNCHQGIIQVVSGAALAQLWFQPSSPPTSVRRVIAKHVMGSARQDDLREFILALQRKLCIKTESGGPQSGASSSGAASAQQQLQQQMKKSMLPDKKSALIEYITEGDGFTALVRAAATGEGEGGGGGGSRDVVLHAFAELWDDTVGHVIRVHPAVKRSVQRLMTYFHVTCEYHPLQSAAASSATDSAAQPPLPSSNIAVLATIGRVELPMSHRMSLFRFPLLHDEDVVNDEAVAVTSTNVEFPVVPRNLLLFSTPAEFELYISGLRLQSELFDIFEGFGSRDKARSAAFATELEGKVESALQTLERIERAHREDDVARLRHAQQGSRRKRPRHHHHEEMKEMDASFVASHSPPSPLPSGNNDTAYTTVRDMLREHGYRCHHLMKFLPMYKWFQCLEYLVEVAQIQRAYTTANRWLHVLLDRPVFEIVATKVLTGGSPGAVPAAAGCRLLSMCHRFQARGKWLHRLAVNLQHLKREDFALKFIEERLEACALVEGAAKRGEAAKALLNRLERHRHAGWRVEECLWQATTEITQQHFMRRADRMAVERALVRMHKPPRRWGGLPKHLLLPVLLEAPVDTLRGERDPYAGGWTNATNDKSACRVEEHVRRYYLAGRGRREVGWQGLHCEGHWIALLTRILFLEAFVWAPDHADTSLADLDPGRSAGGDSTLWISPFQADALDVNDNFLGFVERRRSVLRRCLERLQLWVKDRPALCNFVRSRTTANRNLLWRSDDDDVDDDPTGELDTAKGGEDEEGEGGRAVASGRKQLDGDETQRERSASSTSLLNDNEDDEGSEEADKNEVVADGALPPQAQEQDEATLAYRGEEERPAVKDHGEVTKEDNVVNATPCGQPSLASAEGGGSADAAVRPVRLSSGLSAAPHAASFLPPSAASYRVDISSFPQLFDLLQCVPLLPLARLFEHFFFSDPLESGQVFRFSGFPDLVLWREATQGSASAAATTGSPSFVLAEVKSPTDVLSEKQLAVNDMLLKCGFDVRVVAVMTESKLEELHAPRTKIVRRHEHAVAQQRLHRRNSSSSSFVKGTATNPIAL